MKQQAWIFSILSLLSLPRAHAVDPVTDGLQTVFAPVFGIYCMSESVIQLVKTQELEGRMCPNGWHVLGYVVLRQGAEYMARRRGTVPVEEVVSIARRTSSGFGKTLIVNLLGESERRLRGYGFPNATIITPKSEKDLNDELRKLPPGSFDTVVVDTHGSAIFGDQQQRSVRLDQLEKFDLLKTSGRFVHFGCEGMASCSLKDTVEFFGHLSPHPVPIFGSSRGQITGRGGFMRYAPELVSKPLYSFAMAIVDAEPSDRPRIHVVPNCLEAASPPKK